MSDYNDATYGDRIAEVYDDLYTNYDPASIDLLAELAGDGPALELGIGTGRIAIPLHKRGVPIQGIDASETMLTRLKAKPGGAEIEVLRGSFAEFNSDKQFKLIYVVFNTFFCPPNPGSAGGVFQEYQSAFVCWWCIPDGSFRP